MTLKENTCPVCSSTDVSIFLEIPQAPVHCNVLYSTREEALQAPRGDIKLGFCQKCTHIFNAAFDPKLMEYSQTYENSLHFSARFQEYARSLASRLIEGYELYGKNIIEIGCGQGDFLRMLCELGENRGFGFDPSFEFERECTDSEQITFIQDFYSERYSHYKADLICCRQVLEHIQYPRELLTTVKRTSEQRENTVVFFEVPNVIFILKDMSIWDIIYEHCGYFSEASLAFLFQSCGFRVLQTTAAYEGQFLCLEALPNHKSAEKSQPVLHDREELAQQVMSFSEIYRRRIDMWQRSLRDFEKTGKQAVIWGAGSKGVSFSNFVNSTTIACLVDISPNKKGKYVPGTGREIIRPEDLKRIKPDVIIVMNPVYVKEIRKEIKKLGLNVQLLPV